MKKRLTTILIIASVICETFAGSTFFNGFTAFLNYNDTANEETIDFIVLVWKIH